MPEAVAFITFRTNSLRLVVAVEFSLSRFNCRGRRYALERRGRGFILAFACGCLLSSAYGFLAGTWPFGVVEAIWAGIAVDRFRKIDPSASRTHSR